jgi:hypothetical protein
VELAANAGAQPRLEAGAQRTLEGVGCSAWFGAGASTDMAFPHSRMALTLLCACGLISAHHAPGRKIDTDLGFHFATFRTLVPCKLHESPACVELRFAPRRDHWRGSILMRVARNVPSPDRTTFPLVSSVSALNWPLYAFNVSWSWTVARTLIVPVSWRFSSKVNRTCVTANWRSPVLTHSPVATLCKGVLGT